MGNVWKEIDALRLKLPVVVHMERPDMQMQGLFLSWEFLLKATDEQMLTLIKHELMHHRSKSIARGA